MPSTAPSAMLRSECCNAIACVDIPALSCAILPIAAECAVSGAFAFAAVCANPASACFASPAALAAPEASPSITIDTRNVIAAMPLEAGGERSPQIRRDDQLG